ncbi:MFS transporter [Streptomyces actinomycinicus]|uniref:MFS transporter n=1 Tax=Streptomyces actinomycinicus TaxID=1695166 RepID=A0A937EJ47_9ACTN|nr:MFS transporter [Streptomyces actinomycinicus]MBL1083101.1 MFS transporter [Streptomyces actinomycinicus]
MYAPRGEPADGTVPGLSAGVVALAWLTQFLVGTDLFVVAPLLPRIAASFGVSAADTGLLVTAFSIAYVVASPLAGRLSDRRDRATVLVAALVLFSAANVGTALAPGFGVLLVARVVAGIAASATGPTVYALVSTRARPRSRAQVLAVVGSGLLTALWVGAPAGSLLGRYVGWQAAFVILAAGTFLVAFPHAFVWRTGPAPATVPTPHATPERTGRPGTGTVMPAEPGTGRSGSAAPETDRSGAAEPGAGRGGAAEPGAGRSGAAEPEAGRSGAAEPEAGRSGAAAPGTGRSGAAAPGTGRGGAAAPGAGVAVFAVAVTALWAFSVYSLYTFLAVALHADGRAGTVTWLLVVYGVGAVVGGQLGGRFADRADPVRVTRAALALTAVLEAVVALVFPVSWALACALGLFAPAAYAFFPAQQRHLVDMFPERATAVLSWNNSALFTGLSLAGAVGGQIVHALDYPALLYIGAAVAVPACAVARGRAPRVRGGEERP